MSIIGLKNLGSTLTQSAVGQKSRLPSVGSLVKNTAIAGLSLTALAGLAQLVYNSYLSPSVPKHNPTSSAIEAYYNRYVEQCDDTSFKSLQTFLNIFETPHRLFNALGLDNNEPPGDLQAFAMDANFKGLNCSLKSYPQDYFSNEMKNILLGRVLTQIQFNQKDLGAVASWLIGQGANPNLQAKMPRKELPFAFESTLTPLMTAYRSLNSTLYADFIGRGANPDQEIYTYSSETTQFDQKTPVLQAIVEDIVRTTQKFQNVSDAQRALEEAYRCPIYKAIIDSSLEQLAKKGLPEKMLNKLKFQLYLQIQQYICKKTFLISQEEDHEHRSEEMKNSFYETFQGVYEFLKKATENSGDVPVEEVKLDKDPLQAEKPQKEFKEKTVFETVTRDSDSMGEAMDTLRNLIKDTAKKAGQLTVDAAHGLGQIGLDIANSEPVQVISEGIKGAGVAIQESAKKAGQLTLDAAHGLGQVGSDIANSEAVEQLANMASKTKETLAGAVSESVEKGSEAFSGAKEAVKGVFQAGYEKVGQVAEVVSANVADAKEALGEFAERVKKSTGDLMPQ